VWEVRVVVANDPGSGRSVQRSFTVHGTGVCAQERRRELVAQFGLDRRALYCRGSTWTVAALLENLSCVGHAVPGDRSALRYEPRVVVATPRRSPDRFIRTGLADIADPASSAPLKHELDRLATRSGLAA
jgi:hypothetical protein